MFTFILFLVHISIGQLARWTFEVSIPTTAGPHLPEFGTGQAIGFHTGTTTYSNPAGNGSPESFSSTNWTVGDYYEFQTTTISASNIILSFDQISSGTGPRDFVVQYSTDGVNFTTFAGAGGAYTVLENAVPNLWTSSASNAASHYVVNLSSVIAINNQTTVYFRLTNTSTIAANGTTVATGGTNRVDNFIVNGSGASIVNFYSKATGNLTSLTTWGTNLDGTGTAPANFTTTGQVFNIRNSGTVALDANWTVSGFDSKIIVGDGILAQTLIIPATASLAGTIDVSNQGTLQLINTALPTLGILSAGSTVEYAQVSTPYVIPSGNTYHHLKLTNNVKTLASGTVIVNGDFMLDGVSNFNGSGSPFSTISLAGNFSMLNGATFEPNPAGDANRITLSCTGNGTQTLSGGGMLFFRLSTLSTPVTSLNILLNGADLSLGNGSGGGLNMMQTSHTLSLGNNNTLLIQGAGYFSSTNTGTITGNISSDMIIDKTAGAVSVGSIGFTASARELNDLSYNCTSGINQNLTLTTPLALVGNLTLNAGLIDIGNNTVTVTGIATGNANSYIRTSGSGVLQLMAITTARTVPVGNSRYNPVIISNGSNLDWSFRVEDVLVVDDPVFATNTAGAVQREWHITPSTNPSPGGADIVFQYDDGDPTQIGAAFNTASNVQVWHEVDAGSPWGLDWVAVNVAQTPTGTPGGVRTASISNWTQFSPFAISTLLYPLPIKLMNFNSVKLSETKAFITWELAVCCSSAARFEVEKSVDSRNYIVLSGIPGSETNRFYSVTDTRLAKGITWYRLKMIDADGKVSYSKVVVIINDHKGVLISTISPNPVHSQAVVTISTAKAGAVHFSIYDIAGRVIKQWQFPATEGSNRIIMNLDGLQAGVYHLVASGDEAKTSYRFVKQ